ncbi:hypothetical protein Cni_G28090 [Canna indica]|uniref:Uncharacterized protein n=1 Tax=Canna indica TaxID=4628 RepID=A0AAQ3L8X7_9LILI|nr:hypothetical protein Cni_G28090 [Canna indica]
MDLTCKSPAPDGKLDLEKEVAEDGEVVMLLMPTVNGGMSDDRQKSSRRKVQWNDSRGDKLVEVLEFEPSDSSDSDDKYGGSCTSNVMYIYCICSHGNEQSFVFTALPTVA